MKTAGVLAGLLIAAATPLNAQTLGYVSGGPDSAPMATRTPASVDLNAPALLHTIPTLHAVHLGIGVADTDRGSTTLLFAAPSLTDLLVEQPPRAFDIDQALAAVLDTHDIAFMQRTRQRPQRSQAGSGDPVLKWVGVGLMVVGGLGVLNSVAWCGANAVCTTPLVVYGGAAGVGWYLFANNR